MKNLISRVTTLLDSNVQFSTKNERHSKRQETMAHSKEKKTTETVPEKDLMADLLPKDFETVVLKMLKKMMGEQNRKYQ